MDVTADPASTDTIARAQRHDRAAFTELVSPRLERWLRIASAILGNETDALDALQGTLVAVWSTLPRLRDASRFEGWSTRILVNESRRVLRRRVRTRVHEVSLNSSTMSSHAAGHSGLDDLADAEGRAALERAFERLGVDARAILVLHHLEDRPVVAIAETLGIPEGTVKSRLFTARGALARALAKENP